MTRTAKCHCGALEVECEGEPDNVVMCHCELCQRRTGTSYNLGAWFSEKDVIISGDVKQYIRTGDAGKTLTFNFCPECGSNVFWRIPEIEPGSVGIAVGCFADPDFVAPTISIHGKGRHQWLEVPSAVPSLMGSADSDPE
jgi:hypothetical protein